MALMNFFRKAPETPEKYILVEDGKQVRRVNPLPVQFPSLYEQETSNGFLQKEEILADADNVAKDLLYACHMPMELLPKILRHNLGILLDVPIVYDLFVSLKRQKLNHLYENNLALLPLTQICSFYAKTEYGLDLRDNMMTCMLAISLRHLGVNFIKRESRELLKQQRQWDVGDSRQKNLRDQFLKRYRVVADDIASKSADHINELLQKKHTLSPERYKELLQIIRYSTRLMGRAAATLKLQEKESVYALASYVAMLYNFASAWVGKRKRTCLILAEEWGRGRTSLGKKEFESRALQNMQALSDLFRLCRCQVLSNFQDMGSDAIYSVTERILIKEVPIVVEMKEGSETSVRRFVSNLGKGGSPEESDGPRTASDIRSRLKEGEAKAISVRRSRIQTRWQCFKSKRPIQYRGRSLMEALEKKRRTVDDPTDDELESFE